MVYIIKNYRKNKDIEKVLQQNYDAFQRFQGFQPNENVITYVDKQTGLTILQKIDTEDAANIKNLIKADNSIIFTVGLKDGEGKR
jgi:hypothetical protein